MIVQTHTERQQTIVKDVQTATGMVIPIQMPPGRSTTVQMPSRQKAHNGPTKTLTDTATMLLVSKRMRV